MKSNPTCEHLRDRVLQLKAAAISKADRLEANLVELQGGCKEAQRDYVAQISNLQIRGRDENTGLAEATHEQLAAQEAWRVKQKQLSMLMDDYHSEMQRCNDAIAALQNEVCALQKVRGELAKMEGVKTQAPFQDCEVSEWATGECSITCGGGGTRRLVRRVVAAPVQGAACPPLEMEEACGNEACPVDCKTGDWGGWSECTAPCGGGVQERVRRVVQERQHGGQPCRQSADTRQCNVQACNRDCELERWSDWTPCSQTCGGGTTRRSRGVASEPLGLGTCPAPDSADRVRYRECNEQPCSGPADQQTARCEAKIDLVLLLDGSTAVDDVGWYQLRSAAADILSAMWGGKESVRVAALLFGGQVQASRCGAAAGPLGSLQVDLAADCGIKWLGHLPDALAPSALATTIKGLDWPAGSALISVALGAVQTELLGVREGARPVVLVLTAGQPVSPEQVSSVAEQLRRSARLMWVPVVRGSASAWPQLEAIKTWASRPLRENVIAVEGYSTLATPAAVRRIVEEVCANPT